MPSHLLIMFLITLCCSRDSEHDELILWVKNGDDCNNTLHVAIKIPSLTEDEDSDENEYFTEQTIFHLKHAILIDPILSPLYESTDQFNIIYNGSKLQDTFPLSLLSSDDILECKLRVPEVYKIRRLRTFCMEKIKSAWKRPSKTINKPSDQWITNTDIGTYKRIANGDTQSFIELGVALGNAPEIKTLSQSNKEFEKQMRYYQHNAGRNGNCYDVYTFEPQNLFFIRFEFESSRPDGVYWLSRFNESGVPFHRFTMVSVSKYAFMVASNKHNVELDELIVSNVKTSIRVRVVLGAYYEEIICFRKLTHFPYL